MPVGVSVNTETLFSSYYFKTMIKAASVWYKWAGGSLFLIVAKAKHNCILPLLFPWAILFSNVKVQYPNDTEVGARELEVLPVGLLNDVF